MKTLRFTVPDVEHEGDINHFRNIILDAGGEIEKVYWSGEDGDDAYITFRVADHDVEQRVRKALKNATE